MQLTLNEFFAHLITRKTFYGRLASSLQRIRKPGLGTLAVGIRDGRAAIFYDPEFLKDLSVSAGIFALEHEMLHLVLDHIPRYLELLSTQPTEVDRKKAAAVYNIAMDCSINTMLRQHEGFQDIENHLKAKAKTMLRASDAEGKLTDADIDGATQTAGMVLPEKYDLPLEGSFESYQYLLMRKVKLLEIQIPSFGGNTHDFWSGGDDAGEGDGSGEGKDKTAGDKGGSGRGKGKGKGRGKGKGAGGNGDEKGNKDIIFSGSTFKDMSSEELLSAAHRVREQLKETMRQTIRSMGGLGRGTLPGNLEEWLKDYLSDPIVPWWEVFSTFARMSRMSKYKRSATLPNRALLALSEEDPKIIPAPGRVRDQSWRIFFMVDTSGSMSSESLEIAKSELHHMLQVDEGMEIRYMQGDCVVHSDVVLKAGDDIPAETVGRGGTDFDAYFAHMGQYVGDDQKSPDLVVVYTDGYAPPVSAEHRLPDDVPVLWLVTPQHSANFENYGHVIVCDNAHNANHSSNQRSRR